MMPDVHDAAARFDPFEVAADDRPYLGYARFRAAGPILRAGPGVWAVPRHREVAALLRDPRLGPFRFQETYQRYLQGTAAAPDPGPARALLEGILLAAKGADHARIRKVLARALNARLTPALKSRIESYTATLLADARERGDVDIVSALAYPLPVLVMRDLFGIPGDDGDAVAQRVLALSKMFSPIVTSSDGSAADAAVVWLRQFIGTLCDQRTAHASDDLVSDVAAALAAGTLSRAEAVDNTILAIFAGLETSISLIAGGCAALAQFPDQFATLRRNPACVSSAIDEFLRYDAPTQITARIVEEPIDIDGRTLRKGRIVLLLLGSANHDEREFTDPERLDVERTHNPHVSFGGGPHYCLGAGLAQIETAVVFAQIAATCSTFELAGDIVRERCATPRIYTHVPVHVG